MPTEDRTSAPDPGTVLFSKHPTHSATGRAREQLTLRHVREEIASPPPPGRGRADTRALVEGIRAAYGDDEGERRRLKGQLPVYTFQTTGWTRPRSRAQADSATGLMCVDIDYLATLAVAEGVRDALAEQSWCALAFVSPSGRGVKAVCRVAGREGGGAYNRREDDLHGAVNLLFIGIGAADERAKGWARLCYTSFDPGARLNEGASELDVDGMGRWWKQVQPLNPDDRNDWYSAARAYQDASRALGEEACLGAWIRWSRSGDERADWRQKLPGGGHTDDEYRELWEGIRGEATVVLPSAEPGSSPWLLERVRERVALPDLRWNLEKNFPETLGGLGWETLTATHEKLVADALETVRIPNRSGGSRRAPTSVEAVRRVLSQGPAVAPMMEYLERCEGGVGSVDPDAAAARLGREVGIVLGLDPHDALEAFVSRELLIAAAALRLRPGAVVDWAPILVGPQGCGKTSFVEALLPDELKDYITMDYSLDVDAVERATEASGKLILGVEDLQGLQRATRGALRKMVSERSISARMKYGAHSSRVLRTWVIIVTANPDEPLVMPGDEDSRRWLICRVDPPRPVRGGRMPGAVAARRDRWWGLAMAAARRRAASGAVASRVPPALYAAVAERAGVHAPDDTIREAVNDLLPRLLADDREGKPWRGERIFDEVSSLVRLEGGVSAHRPDIDWGNGRSRDAQTMYRHLINAGLERRRLKGVTVWRSPKRRRSFDQRVEVDLR